MVPPVIDVRGLCKAYPGFRLEDVCFAVPGGSICGFVGRNGAGKTTTIKALLRVVRPDAGTVRIDGWDMARGETEARAAIGYVSGTAAYYPKKTLRQIAAVTRPFYPHWDEAVYRRLMDRFRLEEGKKVCQLSEGMKVKFQLALAMSHHAKLLILDEPTSGLDPVSRDELLDLFRTLREEEGVTIFFSTHITSDLEACADHIVYIRAGRILFDGPLAAFRAGYRLVEGPREALTPELEAALVGPKKHQADFSGLVPAEKTHLAAGCRLKEADLQTIMVHLEKESAE